MGTATLTNLRDYLYGTLTPDNMRWLATQLTKRANIEEMEQLRPFTMKEIDEMLDEAEAAFDTGDYLTNEEVFHKHKEAIAV